MEFIFDTNAYRTIVHNISIGEVISLSKKFNRYERNNGHTSAVSTVVLMELIQHLTDEDPAREVCYKALVFAFFHTSRFDPVSEDTVGSYYPPMNIILAQIFFDNNSKYKKLYDRVISLFLELVEDVDLEKCKVHEKDIKAVRAQIIFEKEEIRNNVETFLSSLNNGILDWKYINTNKDERDRFFSKLHNGDMSILLANALMLRAHQIMDADEIIPDAELKLKAFIKTYEAALNMNLTLMQSIGNGANLQDVTDKRWNTLNDVQIMFALLYLKNDSDEKALVTEEVKIKESAENAGISERVINIDKYLELIKLH